MTTATTQPWEAKRTSETRMVEDFLGQHFKQVDSYRYNSASIRVRVIDPRFEGMSREKRDAMVEQYLDQLPPETQRDIVTLFTFAPLELERTPTTFREYMLNTEFDDPSPSTLSVVNENSDKN
jgi:stress-induced morphogen